MKVQAIAFYIVIALFSCNEPKKAMTVEEAESKGIMFDSLNVIYKSAASVDTSRSVFKDDTDIARVHKAYDTLLNDFGTFLKKNNFKWKFPISCFQKIYFDKDGSIDYLLFNFLGEPPYKISQDQELRFKELLNKFIQDYKYPITANEKFAQCGTIVYGSK